MIETLYLVIPKAQWITANLRLHPMARAKRVRALRKRTAIEARKAAVFSFEGRVRITAKIYARSARRVDPNKAAGTTAYAMRGSSSMTITRTSSGRIIGGRASIVISLSALTLSS